jgi:DNA polymerase-3 subunit alpha
LLVAVGTLSHDDFSGGSQMRASSIMELDEARAAFLARVTVRIEHGSGEVVGEVERALASAETGSTSIAFEVHSSSGVAALLAAAPAWRRRFDEALVTRLRDIAGERNLVFRYNRELLRDWREDPSDAAA